MFEPSFPIEVIEAPIKTAKYHELAEAIRRGLLLVEERLQGRHIYLMEENDRCFGCAIGIAAVGIGCEASIDGWFRFNERDGLIARFGVEAVNEAEAYFEGWSGTPHTALETADWLDTRDGGDCDVRGNDGK